MSTLKEKNTTLFKLLAEYYEGIGLKADLKKATFSDDTRQVYWYPYHKSIDKIIYQPRLTLRFPDIQKIHDTILPNKPNLTIHRVLTKTLIDELKINSVNYAFLDENNTLYYSLDNDTSIEEIISDHQLFMEEIGFQFFKQLNTLKSIHHFINDDLLSSPIQTLPPEQFSSLRKKSLNQEVIAGLIAAFLLSQKTGLEVYEARLLLHDINMKLKKQLELVASYFNS